MKIEKLDFFDGCFVTTDEQENNGYTRYGPNIWNVAIGESQEAVHDTKELETLFQDEVIKRTLHGRSKFSNIPLVGPDPIVRMDANGSVIPSEAEVWTRSMQSLLGILSVASAKAIAEEVVEAYNERYGRR